MKVLVKYEDSLKPFLLNELKEYGKAFEELTTGVGVINADYKRLVVDSGLVKSVGVFIGFDSCIDNFKNFKYDEHIKKSESFRVKCSDKSVCIKLGQVIKDSTRASVSLENPDKIVIVELVGSKYLAYLLISEGLENRGYNVSNTNLINGNEARAMVDFTGWSGEGLILDPFCNEGLIVIEAALKGLSVGPGYFKSKNYDFEIPKPKVKKLNTGLYCYSNSLSELKFAKQNAKLARVFKYLRFGFHDLSDLDYKIKEKTVDYLVTVLPSNVNLEKLFFQLDYIMKDKSVLVFLTKQELKGYGEEYDFVIIDELKLKDKKLVKMVRKL